MAAPGRQALQMDEAMALAESYQAQLESLEVERQRLAAIEAECEATRRGLERLAKAGEEAVMVPVGAGTFVHATLHKVDHVVTPIGAGVHVACTVAEAGETLTARATDAKKGREKLEETMGRIEAQLQDIVGAIQSAQRGGAPPGAEGDA